MITTVCSGQCALRRLNRPARGSSKLAADRIESSPLTIHGDGDVVGEPFTSDPCDQHPLVEPLSEGPVHTS